MLSISSCCYLADCVIYKLCDFPRWDVTASFCLLNVEYISRRAKETLQLLKRSSDAYIILTLDVPRNYLRL